MIVGKPGADDTAINNYLQTILDADQYKHVLYQLDETGQIGSEWFFGDELSGADTFSSAHEINQSQADSIQEFSGVNYIFPDTVVEGLSTDRPGFDPNASIAAYTDPPADKRSAPWMGTPHLVKRNPQVGYTRQVNARDEFKLLSNYYTADQPEELDLTDEDCAYETPVGTGTWVYLVSEFYDQHPVCFTLDLTLFGVKFS